MIAKEQAERLVTLIDSMIDVKTDRATATEESESASVAQFQRQERGRTAQYLEIGFRFLINHFLATCAADFLFRSFFWQGRSWRFPVTLLRLRFRVV